jgi:hypothetical protein
MTPVQQRAFDAILALREYSAKFGLVMRRSQNSLLASLSDSDLAAVVLELKRYESNSSKGTEQSHAQAAR